MRCDTFQGPVDQPALGSALVGMVHSAGDWWIRNRTMSRPALTTYLVGLLWNGFAGIAADPSPGQGAGSGASLH